MEYTKTTESDVERMYITPAVEKAGWDSSTQIRQQVYFTDGRIIVRGQTVKQGKPKKADYILYYKPNIPLAIIEAKNESLSLGAGMQQGLEYAQIMDIPFVYSSNGKGFIEHDRLKKDGVKEREISLDEFPTPQELWEKYKSYKEITEEAEEVVTQDFYSDGSGKTPRYYQLNAINRTIEAISKGQDRILLVMATGTGKTYTAFQIIWRLWKSRKKKRILFLADRNILVDQTKNNDFKPFGNAMTKISKRQIDKAYEIYLSLYQAVTGTEEEKNIYKQFSPDFFDLIVVDECHRGSAAEDSNWHDILDYFSSATHIGLTATPKETTEVSNTEYFGSPIYTYSLKQGINDGFLAPYKVMRLNFDKDLGVRFEQGKTDKYGDIIEDKEYTVKDMDRTLVISDRHKKIAKRISEYLRSTDLYSKTIIFCENIEHAENIRMAMVNENPSLVTEDERYVVRITGDSDYGKAQLDYFIDPESTYPVIAVTSKLMSTGVDSKTCKLIVLDRSINSMTEFKQIIGRGSRLHKDENKYYYTIMDFRDATRLFADPEFDGEAEQVLVKGADDEITEDTIEEEIDIEPNLTPEEIAEIEKEWEDGKTIDFDYPEEKTGVKKYYVDDLELKIINERVEFLDDSGKLANEDIKTYTKKNMINKYPTKEDFIKLLNSENSFSKVLKILEENCVFANELKEAVGKDYSLIDCLLNIVYEEDIVKTKQERVKIAKTSLEGYDDKQLEVLKLLLEKFIQNDLTEIENSSILRVSPFDKIGTPIEISKLFGKTRIGYLDAVKDLKQRLYGDIYES
ncbi:MAG: DEAD/DEAH box helicase family protein [Alphaproteobacteria bacterium]|nr:DEAD/DEAH box helicase family protein [Alphaproteobacteria bacterium]